MMRAVPVRPQKHGEHGCAGSFVAVREGVVLDDPVAVSSRFLMHGRIKILSSERGERLS